MPTHDPTGGRATLSGERPGGENTHASTVLGERLHAPTEPRDPSMHWCPHVNGSARGNTGESTRPIHDRTRQRSRCTVCRQTWCAWRGTVFEGRRTPTERRIMVITWRSSRDPVHALMQACGLEERPVAAWRDRAGQHDQAVHAAMLEQDQRDVIPVQAEEIRGTGRTLGAWMGGVLRVSTRRWHRRCSTRSGEPRRSCAPSSSKRTGGARLRAACSARFETRSHPSQVQEEPVCRSGQTCTWQRCSSAQRNSEWSRSPARWHTGCWSEPSRSSCFLRKGNTSLPPVSNACIAHVENVWRA